MSGGNGVLTVHCAVCNDTILATDDVTQTDNGIAHSACALADEALREAFAEPDQAELARIVGRTFLWALAIVSALVALVVWRLT